MHARGSDDRSAGGPQIRAGEESLDAPLSLRPCSSVVRPLPPLILTRPNVARDPCMVECGCSRTDIAHIPKKARGNLHEHPWISTPASGTCRRPACSTRELANVVLKGFPL